MRKILGALLVLLAVVQIVPYGHRRSNPPIISEPSWNSDQTRATFNRACSDCHSHQTRWPWYSYVAPASWFLIRHVEHGREEFNVSRWGVGENEGDEAAENVRSGKMPLRSYLFAHREARLTDAERAEFALGLAATFGDEGGGEHEAETD